jgi:flagellar hook-associated protein 3 FlgL
MKASSVSSTAISQALRYSMMRTQMALVTAQKEAATGRVADAGLALGARTAQSVSFARDIERLDGIVKSNALVSARLTATQTALGQISSAAQDFLSTLTASVSGDAAPSVTLASANATLDALTSILNTSLNGEYLFAGINTDFKPINSFTDANSPSKAAFDTAFNDHFGFTQTSAAAAGISAAAMDNFLTAILQPHFMLAGGDWQPAWSNATDQTIVSRIALNETTETSVSANNDGVRRLMMATATIKDLFSSNLSTAGKQQLIERAVAMVGGAIGELADLQSRTGIVQKRVADASDRIKMQSDLFERNVMGMEGVDPYEASTRVADLLAHIETSYALTARIQQLSLLRFLG